MLSELLLWLATVRQQAIDMLQQVTWELHNESFLDWSLTTLAAAGLPACVTIAIAAKSIHDIMHDDALRKNAPVGIPLTIVVAVIFGGLIFLGIAASLGLFIVFSSMLIDATT